MQKKTPAGPADRPAVLQNLERRSDADLLNIFKNCVRLLAKGENRNAQLVQAAIEKEWRRRIKTWSGDARPSEGMLAALGYHVGNNGESLAVRRRILRHVIEGDLPVIESVAYTNEWGGPGSQQRLEKLMRVLSNMVEGARNNPSKTAAIAHWQADMDWLVQELLQERCARDSH
ncbi:hypothetical protein ACQR10_06255 [Bradyrhizobium sp. HKCCYLRH2060]|uniref:hypothetical protein n=1 Tax=Bradyrhizobium TaxID=374 RepID=UPI0029170B78|nr:hypothetical protein [Bradyrhizobium sp. SZCCHNR3003]